MASSSSAHSSESWLGAIVERTGTCIEAVGVAVIVIGAAYGSVRYLLHLRREGPEDAYVAFRRGLARSILLGLEFLVAGDIIRTVVLAPSWSSVGLLGAIVVIRTFLSFTLEVEVTGRWPWRRGSEKSAEESSRKV